MLTQTRRSSHGLDPRSRRLPVSDIDAAIAFYRDKVGFDLDHDTEITRPDACRSAPLRGSGCSIVVGDLPSQREMAPGSMRVSPTRRRGDARSRARELFVGATAAHVVRHPRPAARRTASSAARDGELRLTSVHGASRFDTEWREGGDRRLGSDEPDAYASKRAERSRTGAARAGRPANRRGSGRCAAASSRSTIRGSTIRYSRPCDRRDPPPAANRFLAHWVASPNGSGIMKPSGVRSATTGGRVGRAGRPARVAEDRPTAGTSGGRRSGWRSARTSGRWHGTGRCGAGARRRSRKTWWCSCADDAPRGRV